MYAPFHSASVNSALALKSGWVRPSLTKRARRQATTIYTASANSSLATLPSCRASTRQPFLSTLKNVSISQRQRYQSINSTTSAKSLAMRLVSRCHCTALQPAGGFVSLATTQVTVNWPPAPSGMLSARAQICWHTTRAASAVRAARVNSISPKGASSMVCAHDLLPSGKARLCFERISQSAGCPRSRARRIISTLPAPQPSVGDARRCACGRDGIGRVPVHAALGFVGQGPAAFDALPVEIQLGGVLQAQTAAVLSHPCCGALDVRGQHRFPFQGPFGVVGLIKESIRPLRFAPIRTCARNAGCGFVGKSLRGFDQAMIQARISQLRSCKFFCCPCHRGLFRLKMNQAGKRYTRLKFSSIAGMGVGFKEEGCV